jgi:hypothetical protein
MHLHYAAVFSEHLPGCYQIVVENFFMIQFFGKNDMLTPTINKEMHDPCTTRMEQIFSSLLATLLARVNVNMYHIMAFPILIRKGISLG